MPRARLVDVASQAGVSPATASLVLRGQPGPSQATRAAVAEAAQALGYRADRAASLLASRRSHLVGVVLDVRNTFHAELAVALEEAAQRAGLELVLATLTPSRAEAAAVATLIDNRCEGLVLLGASLSGRALGALTDAVPTVVVGRAGVGEVVGVRVDDGRGMAVAVDHLAGLGHRRIAHLQGPSGVIGAARTRGFLTAMRRAGLADGATVVQGGDDEAAGLAAVAALLAVQPPVTAVVAYNDRSAMGLREGLARHGIRVPDDLSLVGYDDSPLARLATLDLTSVSQDPVALAEAAIGVLAARLAQADTPASPAAVADVVITPRLVIRTSTAAR